MQTKVTPNVIPNKHTEKVKSNEKHPRKKLCCAFCISVEYKRKRTFPFFSKYQIYFILCCENISILTRAMHSWKILIIFHRTRWNIFGIHLKKYISSIYFTLFLTVQIFNRSGYHKIWMVLKFLRGHRFEFSIHVAFLFLKTLNHRKHTMVKCCINLGLHCLPKYQILCFQSRMSQSRNM